MESVRFAIVAMVFMGLTACTHALTMHSRDGERLVGRWRFAREGTGLVQVVAANGEVLVGAFQPVPRRIFFENYQNTFGGGSIDADAPDLFAYGNVFGGLLGNSNALADVAYGENYNKSAGESLQAVRGPLLYWTANLQGDRSTAGTAFAAIVSAPNCDGSQPNKDPHFQSIQICHEQTRLEWQRAIAAQKLRRADQTAQDAPLDLGGH